MAQKISKKNLKLSIIIPTYNGNEKILTCLNSLEKQSCKDFETIVIIDGSTDSTLEILSNHSFDLKAFSYHFRQNGGRSRARNTGVDKASGDLILFLDDDMIADPSLVSQHINSYQKTNGIIVGTQLEDHDRMKTDFQRFKASLSKKWMSQLGKSFTKLSTPFITAANFSISKDNFKALGGFDEKLTDCEDYDLAIKAFETENNIYYNPQCVAWHQDLITCKGYIKRLKEYRKAILYLLEIYPDRYLNKVPEIKKNILKTLVFGLFQSSLWVSIIDKNLLLFLPKSIRYKIYELVITSQSNYFESHDK